MELDIHRWCVWSDNINIAAFLWEIPTPTLPNFLCTPPPPSFRRGDSGALPSISMRKKKSVGKKPPFADPGNGRVRCTELFLCACSTKLRRHRKEVLYCYYFFGLYFFLGKAEVLPPTKFGLVLPGQTVAFVGNRGRQKRQSFPFLNHSAWSESFY